MHYYRFAAAVTVAIASIAGSGRPDPHQPMTLQQPIPTTTPTLTEASTNTIFEALDREQVDPEIPEIDRDKMAVIMRDGQPVVEELVRPVLVTRSCDRKTHTAMPGAKWTDADGSIVVKQDDQTWLAMADHREVSSGDDSGDDNSQQGSGPTLLSKAADIAPLSPTCYGGPAVVTYYTHRAAAQTSCYGLAGNYAPARQVARTFTRNVATQPRRLGRWRCTARGCTFVR